MKKRSAKKEDPLKLVARYIMLRMWRRLEEAVEVKNHIDLIIERNNLDSKEIFFFFGDPDNPQMSPEVYKKAEKFLFNS